MSLIGDQTSILSTTTSSSVFLRAAQFLNNSSLIAPGLRMLSPLRPLLRPLPLIGISTSGLILAAAMSTSSKPSPPPTGGSRNWTVKQYTPRHTSWPYQPSDFTRQDESTDTSFYSSPRFVTHIDDAAIASLREYYDGALPKKGRILDFCTSNSSMLRFTWITFILAIIGVLPSGFDGIHNRA